MRNSGRANSIGDVAKTFEQLVIASDHKAEVGKNLRLARESLGISQAKMARNYGFAANRLNQWEAGIYYPDPYFLSSFCRDFGFSMDWFYRGQMGAVSASRVDDLRAAIAADAALQKAAALLEPQN